MLISDAQQTHKVSSLPLYLLGVYDELIHPIEAALFQFVFRRKKETEPGGSQAQTGSSIFAQSFLFS